MDSEYLKFISKLTARNIREASLMTCPVLFGGFSLPSYSKSFFFVFSAFFSKDFSATNFCLAVI